MRLAELAELAAIAILLVGFGVVLFYPGLTPEARAGAFATIVGALLVIARLRSRPWRG